MSNNSNCCVILALSSVVLSTKNIFVTFSNPFRVYLYLPTYAYPVPSGIWILVYLIVQFSKYMGGMLKWSDPCMYSLWLNSGLITNLCGCFPEFCLCVTLVLSGFIAYPPFSSPNTNFPVCLLLFTFQSP